MRRKGWLVAAVAVSLSLGDVRAETSPDPMLPTIQSKAAMLINARTGEVLYSKNEFEQRPIASTQKLLTALLVIEDGDLDKPVTITHEDTLAAPTKLGFKAGDVYTRRELLTGLLVRSFNDVADALARDVAGSVEAFVERMNQRAREMGATNSHFKNPNGLPAEGQYSTAHDLAVIAVHAYYNPVIRSIVGLKESTFYYADGRTMHLRNTNRVLREEDFCNGMKTGYTIASGHCLVASGAVEDREMIAVILGGSKSRVAWEANNLLRYGLGLAQRPEPSSPSAPKTAAKTKTSARS